MTAASDIGHYKNIFYKIPHRDFAVLSSLWRMRTNNQSKRLKQITRAACATTKKSTEQRQKITEPTTG